MPTLVRCARDGRWPPLATPDTARDFVWVDDACDAFLRAATSELSDLGAIFNVASGTQTPLRTLIEVVRRAFAIELEPSWGTMEARSWDTAVWMGDPSSASETLGWRATTPLDVGLHRLADWLDRSPNLRGRYASSLSAP